MAAADVAAGVVAEPDQRRMEQGQGTAGETAAAASKQLLTKDKEKALPQWYVNGQGQTMVVIPGPVEFVMGSPSTEEGRNPNELQHKQRIGRTFALAAKPVTLEQYRKFDPRYGLHQIEIEQWTRTADSPVIANELVSGGGLLQLAEPAGRISGERMVLRAAPRPQGPACAGGEQRRPGGGIVRAVGCDGCSCIPGERTRSTKRA